MHGLYCVFIHLSRWFTFMLRRNEMGYLIGFYWVLPGFTRSYWVLLGFNGFYLVLLGFIRLYWVLMGFNGF